jgi:hypothetical protein
LRSQLQNRDYFEVCSFDIQLDKQEEEEEEEEEEEVMFGARKWIQEY